MNIDQQLDTIYDMFNDHFINGRFWLANEQLRTFLESGNDDIDIILGYLTVTLPAKYKLPDRVFLLQFAETIMSKELLKGLY